MSHPRRLAVVGFWVVASGELQLGEEGVALLLYEAVAAHVAAL